ncbi:TonB family protein [Desulfoluna sp.]|uniref:TonB family protein n=1 Tax=Desulfoluna sp. TaxID=2045199 RepID=UPI00260E1A22|nr:TonB family protein [Desulfoluna sp.]
MKPTRKNITSNCTLALAGVLSLILHALCFQSGALKSHEEPLAESLIPLEMETGPAVVPLLEAYAPDLPPKVPVPPSEKKPLNRHAAIKKYLVQVRKKIEKNKFNTPGKKDAWMIGNARIGFHINRNGSFENIRIVRSSGDTRLDNTAKNAVAYSSGKVKRPPSTGKTLVRTSVVIKYQYGL